MDSPHSHDELVPERADIAARTFLVTIREEQQRYLANTRAAAEKLAMAGGQLTQVAAMHNGLTRQLFDAQRCVFNHRARVDAEVRAIEAAAEADATATITSVLVAAAEQGRLDDVRPLTFEPASGWTEPHWQSDEPSVQREITALGRSVTTSAADADALESMVNEALRPSGPDADGAHDALAVVLAGWWRAEVQESRAAVDDAHARAIMMRHIAAVQASEMCDAARVAANEVDVREDHGPLPDEVVAGLDAAESGIGLHSVLASLVESLEHSPGLDDGADVAPISGFPELTAGVGSPDSFRRFWEAVPAASRSRRLLGGRST